MISLFKSLTTVFFTCLAFFLSSGASAEEKPKENEVRQNQETQFWCLKVNVWSLSGLPEELQNPIKQTISFAKSRDPKRYDFSRTHGKDLRLGADGVRPNIPCNDIQRGKVDDTAGINTGKWKRSQTEYTVRVTYRTGITSTQTVEAKTVDGIARFYFPSNYKFTIDFAEKDQFISPVQGYIYFDASEWVDSVMSVHALTP